MNESITVISSLFYIKDHKSMLKQKHDYLYKNWVKSLLSLNCFLVFHTDDYYYDFILNERVKYDSYLNKTVIIKTSIDRLDCCNKYYTKINDLLWSESFRNLKYHGIQWNNTDYNIITLNKMFLLKQYSDLNVFNTKFFCWLDAGGIRHEISPNIRWPVLNQSMSLNKFNIFSVVKDRCFVKNKLDYCLTHAAMIQGVSFFASAEIINFVYDIFIKELDDCLDKGFIPTEQKVFDFCCQQHPHLFNVIYAGSIKSTIENTWFKFFDYFIE